ncbi:TPA_asm: nucleoside-diphosphate kinase, partial [Listeria monocytogenes]|nr:nucleoside-diphosphate kinase [Listeria monocytogenes]
MEQTYVMVKPDGVERGLIGEIVTRIEKKGLKIVAGKLMQIDRELAEKHYA